MTDRKTEGEKERKTDINKEIIKKHIQKERETGQQKYSERERKRDVYTYIYIHTHT